MPHLFVQPREVPLSLLGFIVPNAVAYFYDADTSTPRQTFTDPTLTVAHPYPVPANNTGVLPPIWIDPAGGPYKVDIRTAMLSNPLSVSLPRYPVDDLQVGPSADEIGRALYDVTPGEQAAGITPTKYQYPPGHVWRYGAIGDNTFDNWQAFQNAMDSGAGVVYVPNGEYLIGKSLLIKPTSTQNLTVLGEARTNTYLIPKSIDISTAPQNVNALFINQADNTKFSVRNIRFQSKIGVPYTGISIYAKEGGCADGSGQVIFSGSIQDCWFGMASQNSGVFRGGLNNYVVANNVFEFCKGCFYRDGVGMGDTLFVNNQLSNCYDAFYDGTSDTVGDNIVTIANLHAYVHFRGTLINSQNSNNLTTSDVTLQVADVPLSPVGMFNYKNCKSVINSGFNGSRATIFGGSGPIGTGITVESCELMKFSDGIIDSADVGLKLTGTGANSITVDNVSIYRSISAAWLVQTGVPSGTVAINDSDWSQNNLFGVNFDTAAGIDVSFSNTRIVNAGLGGTAGARNVKTNTTGNVRFNNRCKVGRNDVNAVAAYFFEGAGAGPGTFETYDLEQIGSPPTALSIGSQVIVAKVTLQVITGSTTYDPGSLGDGIGVTTTVACNGAVLGDLVQVSFSNDLQGILLNSWISSANTASVRFQNETGSTLDLASGTLAARVLRA